MQAGSINATREVGWVVHVLPKSEVTAITRPLEADELVLFLVMHIDHD